MSEPTLAAVRRTVADVFGVPLEEVDPDSSPESVEQWDSIEHLNLVLALEQAFDLSFDPEQIGKLTSVGAIVEAVEAAGAAARPGG